MNDPTSPRSVITKSLFDSANSILSGSIAPVTNGKRIISGHLLYPPDSDHGSSAHSAVSSSPTATFPILGIPELLETTAAMQWIGLAAPTGDRIINAWLSDQDMEARPLQWHIEQHIRRFEINEPCSNTKNGNWHVAMRQSGISQKMQDAVVEPDFNQVRTMHPLRHWLEEFVIGNYTTLVHMDERIRGNLEQRRTGGPQLHGGANARSDYYLHRTGFTTLYRATTAGRLKEVFLDNEKLHLAKTTSGPSHASDFGFDNYGVFYHWTPDVWAADLYASYCKRVVNNQYDVCVLKIVVRSWDAMVEGATWTLEYGDEWRQLVWHSRNRQQYTGEIGRKHRKTDVFIGPMSCDATKVFNAMGTWESVTEQNVFRYGDHGEVAIQHIFHMPDVMSALNDKAQADLFRCYPENKWLPDPKTWVAGRSTCDFTRYSEARRAVGHE